MRRAKLRLAGLRSEDAGGSSGGAGVPESRDRDVGCITQVTDAANKGMGGSKGGSGRLRTILTVVHWLRVGTYHLKAARLNAIVPCWWDEICTFGSGWKSDIGVPVEWSAWTPGGARDGDGSRRLHAHAG
jgi:hypothetical protein